MVRTQIYLTDRERSALSALAVATGRKQSELIREAVDLLIERNSRKRRQNVLDGVAGMWRGRRDLPPFGAMRKAWDRGGARR